MSAEKYQHAMEKAFLEKWTHDNQGSGVRDYFMAGARAAVDQLLTRGVQKEDLQSGEYILLGAAKDGFICLEWNKLFALLAETGYSNKWSKEPDGQDAEG